MRTAVVTGASRGLGSAIARMLAEEGCALVLGARDTEELDRVAADLEQEFGSPVAAQRCDVTASGDLSALCATALDRFGRVDIVVANAGVGSFGRIADFDEERFRTILDVNVLGVWRTMQAFAAALTSAPSTGLLIVVSSDVSARVFPDGGPYVASKHAVRALARTFQQEHPELRVCELRPGSTRTAFNDADPDAAPGAGQLTAIEVADVVRVAVRAPDGVRLEELAVRSTGQAPAY
jgi:3-oxoacyl-[acyl-carrier protein] reductase